MRTSHIFQKNCSAVLLGVVVMMSGVGVLTLSPASVSAQATPSSPPLQYEPLVPLPKVSGPGDAGRSDLSSYIVGMFQLLIGLAAALAVVMIVVGGIEYMSTDAIGGKSDGKKRIQNALWGLALAVSSYLILRTVDPCLLNSDIDVGCSPQTQSQQN